MSYLDIRRENFYGGETTADGIQFAAARGWELLFDDRKQQLRKKIVRAASAPDAEGGAAYGTN